MGHARELLEARKKVEGAQRDFDKLARWWMRERARRRELTVCCLVLVAICLWQIVKGLRG